MLDKSIKLLALAVVCGCSLLGFAITPASDGRILVLLLAVLVSGSWFVVYWVASQGGRR